METVIGDFTKQLMHAMEITESVMLPPKLNQIMNVLIHGMGASGIAGNMAAEVVSPETRIPIIINKDYFLPQFVSENTLVIICSYSGETEESVMALQDAMEKGAYVICITSGGRIQRLAIRANLDLILIPPGIPSCAVTGFLFIQLLYIFNFYGILSDLYNRDLTRAIEVINADENNIMRDAKRTALELLGKFVIIYGTSGMESVALCFRQQLNENAKCLCSYNVFPEINHSELQGWQETNLNPAAVIFRNYTDYTGISRQIDISIDTTSRNKAQIIEVHSKSNTILENILYLVHWGEWVSYYLAKRKGIDIRESKMENYLKAEFAKVEEY
jgi:glucose/mannose-6-phosphate isomerase